MKLKFTRQSTQDLDDIWDYIADDNHNAADSFIDLLREKCTLLAETPELGRERPEMVFAAFQSEDIKSSIRQEMMSL